MSLLYHAHSGNQAVLPDEKWAIYMNGVEITTKIKDPIIFQCHYNHLETYIWTKHNLNEYNIEYLNREGLCCYMSKLKMPQCAIKAKCIHGWLPKQAFLHKQKRETCSAHPICRDHQAAETITHLLSCPFQEATHYQMKLLHTCISSLCMKGHTYTLILNCWEVKLWQELGLPEKKQHNFPGNSIQLWKAIAEARWHQNLIGLDKFLWGFISSKWSIAQKIHNKLFPQETHTKTTVGSS